MAERWAASGDFVCWSSNWKSKKQHSDSAALDEDGGKKYLPLVAQIIFAKENHPGQAACALFSRKIRGLSITYWPAPEVVNNYCDIEQLWTWWAHNVQKPALLWWNNTFTHLLQWNHPSSSYTCIALWMKLPLSLGLIFMPLLPLSVFLLSDSAAAENWVQNCPRQRCQVSEDRAWPRGHWFCACLVYRPSALSGAATF